MQLALPHVFALLVLGFLWFLDTSEKIPSHFQMSELKFGGRKGQQYQIVRNPVTTLEDKELEVETVQFRDGASYHGFILPVATQAYANANAGTQPNGSVIFYQLNAGGIVMQWKDASGVVSQHTWNSV